MKKMAADFIWTEKAIQNALYCFCALKRHELIVPNSKVFGWESDMVSVTQAGYMFEFEVKLSRSDFRADAKKIKSQYMVNPIQQSWGKAVGVNRPNYFYYVVPPDLVAVEELPSFAGLIYAEWHPPDYALYCQPARVIRIAPKLHTDKINEWQRRQLHRAVTFRYWRDRLGVFHDG